MAARISGPNLIKKLKNYWEKGAIKQRYLKKVKIREDGSPLRGLIGSELEFNFPVTVLCGPNGTGKTTFLALSLLAFHGEATRTKSHGSRDYFDFAYFFGFLERDKHPQDIGVKWTYTDGYEDWIYKGKDRWMRYILNSGEPRRPERGTEFIGLSRILPAFESKSLRNAVRSLKGRRRPNVRTILQEHLSHIMSKPYTELRTREATNSSGRHVLNEYNDTHTSFNAGAGEECLTKILDILLSAPDGAIIGIEEIEVGLHPAIMKNLMDAILHIAWDKKLQIIITSHSPDFLRACPKECLVHAERAGNKVNFTYAPNVQSAIYSLSGSADYAINVVCEDEVAATLISSSLSRSQKNLVNIKAYGSDSELIGKAKTINIATEKPSLIVWDGDVSNAFYTSEEIDDDKIFAAKLPGAEAPEFFMRDRILSGELRPQIIEAFVLSDAEYDSMINSLGGIRDAHDIPHMLAFKLEGKTDDNSVERVVSKIANLITSRRFNHFDEIRQKFTEMLSK